jgi:hypothetical protein
MAVDDIKIDLMEIVPPRLARIRHPRDPNHPDDGPKSDA